MTENMTPELSTLLLDRLRHRAERLASVAAVPGIPLAIVALMAEHVTATAMVLCGDEMSKRIYSRLMSSLRDAHGICVCGGALTHGEPLCATCTKEFDDMDAEADRLAMMARAPEGSVPS